MSNQSVYRMIERWMQILNRKHQGAGGKQVWSGDRPILHHRRRPEELRRSQHGRRGPMHSYVMGLLQLRRIRQWHATRALCATRPTSGRPVVKSSIFQLPDALMSVAEVAFCHRLSRSATQKVRYSMWGTIEPVRNQLHPVTLDSCIVSRISRSKYASSSKFQEFLWSLKFDAMPKRQSPVHVWLRELVWSSWKRRCAPCFTSTRWRSITHRRSWLQWHLYFSSFKPRPATHTLDPMLSTVCRVADKLQTARVIVMEPGDAQESYQGSCTGSHHTR